MYFLNPVKKDPRSYGQSPDVTWAGLLGAACFAIIFQICALILFSILRRTKYGKQWLTPKRSVCPDQTPPDLRDDTLFGWLPQLWFMSEVQILMYCGYDVVMFLKVLRLGFWSLCYFAPFALFVILPCNMTAKFSSEYGDGYFVTTIANIRVSDKNRLPVHLIGMCLCQVVLMVLTFNLHLEYIQLRRAFMKQRAREQTVLVTGIPPRMRSTTLVKSYFDVMYSGAVQKVVFVKHIDGLDALVAKREATVLKLERSILFDRARRLRHTQPAVPVTMPGRLASRRSSSGVADIELAEDNSSSPGDSNKRTASSSSSSFSSSGDWSEDTRALDSPATCRLRQALAEQNEQVAAMQNEYAELAATHERRMTLKANKILASNFNLSEAQIESMSGAAPQPLFPPVDTGARRRVVSVDQDEDVARGHTSSYSLSDLSPGVGTGERLSEVADEGDYLSSDEDEGDSAPPPPPPTAAAAAPASNVPSSNPLIGVFGADEPGGGGGGVSGGVESDESPAESPAASDDDLLGHPPPSPPQQQQLKKGSSLSAAIGQALIGKSSANRDPGVVLTKADSFDASQPLEVKVILVERENQVVPVPLPNALMRVEYLKTAVEKETGVKASSQVLRLRVQGKKSKEQELLNGRTLESQGVENGSEISLVLLTNAAMLSTGEAPTSSRRQRLSLTKQQRELIRGDRKDLWNNRSRLREGDKEKRGSNVLTRVLPLTGAVTDLVREVRREELKGKRARPDPGTNSDKAFVTFKTVAAATIASQVVHSVPGHRQSLTVEEAPDARLDMFWGSVHKSDSNKKLRQVATNALDFMLVVFFVLPVAWMSELFGPVLMEKYAQENGWPWFMRALGTTLLPLSIMIISNLLPPLFTGLGFFEGSLTWSLNGLRQLDRMAWFLLVNVFFVSIISGTILQAIVDVLRDPTGTASVVASVLPTMSGFFTQYIMVKACVALSIEILRGLTVFHMVSRWLCQCKDATKRERLAVIIGIRRFNNPGWLPFGKHFAHILLVMMVCLSFAPIAPLIVIPGLIYFAYAQLVYRYTLCYVYEPRFEIGGGYWPYVLKWIIRIMYLSQFFMLSVFVLRSFFYGICGAFVMLFVTRQFQVYMHQKERDLLKLPLEVAIYLDKPDSANTRAVFLAHVTRDNQGSYVQPSLVAERTVLPGRADLLEKKGLWSTDTLHGGLCRWPLELAGLLQRTCLRPFLNWARATRVHGFSSRKEEDKQLI